MPELDYFKTGPIAKLTSQLDIRQNLMINY